MFYVTTPMPDCMIVPEDSTDAPLLREAMPQSWANGIFDPATRTELAIDRGCRIPTALRWVVDWICATAMGGGCTMGQY